MKSEEGNKFTFIGFGAICALLVLILFAVSSPVSWVANDNISSVVVSPIDELSGAVMNINFEHHETHEGDHYFIKTYLEDIGGAGNINYFAFTTQNSKRIHARALLSPDVDFLIEIYEDANISGGVALDEVNNNRDSNNTALLEAFANPTVNDIGVLIWASRNGGGKNPVGVSPGLNYEIIAKTNSTYIFKITKQVVQTGVLNVDFWWYEHG